MTSRFAVLRRAESPAEQPSPSRCAASRTGQAISDIHSAEAGRPTRLTREPRSLPSSVRFTSLGKRPRTTLHLRVELVKGTVLARLSSLHWLPSASRVTDRVTDPGSILRGAPGCPSVPRLSRDRFGLMPAIPTAGLAPSGGIIPAVRIRALRPVWRSSAEGIGRIRTKHWDD
jgi:hypothetical protein